MAIPGQLALPIGRLTPKVVCDLSVGVWYQVLGEHSRSCGQWDIWEVGEGGGPPNRCYFLLFRRSG
jgi:hypothetical protein